MKTNKIIISLITIGHLLIIILYNLMAFQGFKEMFTLNQRSISIIENIENILKKIPIEIQENSSIYSSVSGVTAYGFFAANPAFDCFILFEIKEKNANAQTIPFQLISFFNHKRMKAGGYYFANEQNEKVKELFAQSLATRVHSIYEPLTEIKVFSVSNIIPTMKGFRNGKKQNFELNEEFVFSINNDNYEEYSEHTHQ